MSAVYSPRQPARTRHVTLRDLSIAVTEWGDPAAPRLYYLHGWGDNGATFQFVVDELGKDWHVVAPHWRGFGNSAHAGAYWFPDYLADLHAFLAQQEEDQPVNLVGHSMGGNIASLYSGIFPERVGCLINIEGFGLSPSDPDAAPARVRQWIDAMNAGPGYATYESWEPLAMRIRARSPSLDQARALFVARAWATRHDDGVIRINADPAHKLPNPVLYREEEALAYWSRITAPTTMLVGGTSSERAHAQRFLQTLHSAKTATVTCETVADVGHMIHFEAPEAIARAIDRDLPRDASSG